MSWPLIAVKDFCKTSSGGTPSRDVPKYYDGTIPWIKSGDLREKTVEQATEFITELAVQKSSAKIVPSGAILLAMYGATVGRMAMLGIDAATNQAVCSIVPDERQAYAKYVYYALLAKVPEFLRNAVGGAQPNISQGMIKDTKLLLPPLTEQKRIASILDKADAIRRKRQQAIRLADEFLRVLFLDMFGDPVTNPKGWGVVNSGELYSVPPRIGTTTPAKGEGFLVVRVGEIGQFNIAFERCGRVQLSPADFDKYVLCAGDTVLARAIGSKNQLGKASYYSGHIENVVIDSHVMRLRTNKEICNPEWFYRFISSDGGKSLLQKAGGATAVQFNINSKQASELKIPLPPLILQNKFIGLCSSFLKSSAIALIQEGWTNELFNSLSQKAFSGRL